VVVEFLQKVCSGSSFVGVWKNPERGENNKTHNTQNTTRDSQLCFSKAYYRIPYIEVENKYTKIRLFFSPSDTYRGMTAFASYDLLAPIFRAVLIFFLVTVGSCARCTVVVDAGSTGSRR